MDKHINVPFDKSISTNLKAGDYVYLTGTIYTARDAAHKRMYEALKKGEELPFDVKNNTIYYMGPSPEEKGDRLVLPVLQQRAEWTSMHRHFSTSDLSG